MCVCMYARVCMCLCACVCACVHELVCVCVVGCEAWGSIPSTPYLPGLVSVSPGPSFLQHPGLEGGSPLMVLAPTSPQCPLNPSGVQGLSISTLLPDSF